MNRLIPMRNFFGLIVLFVSAMCWLVPSTSAFAIAALQEPEPEATPEQVLQIQQSGGRIHRISAADESQEISFNLASQPVGDDQLVGINSVEHVIWLNLAGTAITDAGLKHLSGMPLKKLHLERTKIGDAGLQHLKELKDLEYLNIYDTQVTDAGLEHLHGLKNLKKLYIWKTKITDEGIQKLNTALPELKIIGELKLEPVVIEEPQPESAKSEEKPAEKEDKDDKKEDKKDDDKQQDASSDPAKSDKQDSK